MARNHGHNGKECRAPGPRISMIFQFVFWQRLATELYKISLPQDKNCEPIAVGYHLHSLLELYDPHLRKPVVGLRADLLLFCNFEMFFNCLHLQDFSLFSIPCTSLRLTAKEIDF